MLSLTPSVRDMRYIIGSLMLKFRHHMLHTKLIFKNLLFLAKCYLIHRKFFQVLSKDLIKVIVKSDYRREFMKRCLVEYYLSSGELSLRDFYCKLNYMNRELKIKLLRREDIILLYEIFFRGSILY